MDERATLNDVDLQVHYDAMFALFGAPGWRDLMEKVGEIAKARENIRNVPLAVYERTQGELIQIDWLLGLEASYRAAHDILVQQQQLEDLT